ncbi:class I SAM-dependent methyltransferase [Nocardioides bruguierae]|uniref:class I SAM-dependent methyltransferase n=1 Tax=Nocardioides bruguierae TaxID=2945102 RepID=UPI0020200C3F|nr:class I SAM-dependent methyltransferase [Nocardioides bruguierae]MCL8027353.1 class I SAM-dependent methyltransferase [Nocardioides bruguierae]
MEPTRQRAAVRAHYDARADTYDESAMHHDLVAAVASLVRSRRPEPRPGRVVLDVATGTGLALRALQVPGAGADDRLVGVDLSPAMLAVARAHLPTAGLLRGDASRLPVAGGVVDVLTCVTAPHLLPEPEAAVRHWRRVLRPDGLVVTATFADAVDGPRTAPRRDPALPQGFERRHEPFSTPARVADLLAPHGLRLREHSRLVLGRDALLLCAAEVAAQ